MRFVLVLVLVLESSCSRPSASYSRKNPLLGFHPDQCRLTGKAYAAQPDTDRKGYGTKSTSPKGFAHIRPPGILPQWNPHNAPLILTAGSGSVQSVCHPASWRSQFFQLFQLERVRNASEVDRFRELFSGLRGSDLPAITHKQSASDPALGLYSSPSGALGGALDFRPDTFQCRVPRDFLYSLHPRVCLSPSNLPLPLFRSLRSLSPDL